MDTLPKHAYEILRYLAKDSHESEQIKLLNHFVGKINETNDLLFVLEKCNFISCENDLHKGEAVIQITRLGRSALKLHDEQNESMERQLLAQNEALILAQANLGELQRHSATLEREAKAQEETLRAAQTQVAILERQAKTQEEELALAKQNAASAKEEVRAAGRQARRNTMIAVAALIVALFAWLVPREAVFAAIGTFFQLLRPAS